MRILFIIIVNLCFTNLLAQDYWAGISNIKFDGIHFYGVAENLYEVVKLDSEGNIIDTFGRRGNGPNEFSSQYLDLVINDSLLHIADKRSYKLTTINKKTFELVGTKNIDKSTYALIKYSNSVYGMVLDFETTNPFKNGKVQYQFREIDYLKDPNKSLFTYSDQNPINPFYDEQHYVYNDEYVVMWMEGKNAFYLYNGNSIKKINIPFVEDKALGEKIEGDTQIIETPEAKAFWKEKIMPAYTLIKGAALDRDVLYFQVHSYKVGDIIFSYDITSDEFKKIGSHSKGELIAVRDSIIYTVNNNSILQTSLKDQTLRADDYITFYLSKDFIKQTACVTCSDSFYEWIDYSLEKNIPVKLEIEDDSWFGSREVNVELIQQLIQMNIWGAISYSKCNKCFKNVISATITVNNKTSDRIKFPANLTQLKEELD